MCFGYDVGYINKLTEQNLSVTHSIVNKVIKSISVNITIVNTQFQRNTMSSKGKYIKCDKKNISKFQILQSQQGLYVNLFKNLS